MEQIVDKKDVTKRGIKVTDHGSDAMKSSTKQKQNGCCAKTACDNPNCNCKVKLLKQIRKEKKLKKKQWKEEQEQIAGKQPRKSQASKGSRRTSKGGKTLPPVEEKKPHPKGMKKFWRKHIIDAVVLDKWINHLNDKLPYICQCCRIYKPEFSRAAILHVMNGHEFPSKDPKKDEKCCRCSCAVNNDDTVECLLCACTMKTCPPKKKEINIDVIRAKAEYLCQNLCTSTKESYQKEIEMSIDIKGQPGLFPMYRQCKDVKMADLPCPLFQPRFYSDDSSDSIGSDLPCKTKTKKTEKKKKKMIRCEKVTPSLITLKSAAISEEKSKNADYKVKKILHLPIPSLSSKDEKLTK